MMQKVDGPTCPKCGCNSSRILKRLVQMGRVHLQRQCHACLRIFHTPEKTQEVPKVVDYPPRLRCPRCKGTKVRCQGVRHPLRQHRCLECAWTFQSVEKMN